MRAFVITVVLLLGLLVAADRGAWYYAEGQVAQTLRVDQGLATDPDVSIQGFPFLTQLVNGSYQQVDIGAADVDAPDLGPVSVSASLRDVAVPASEVVGGTITRFTAGQVDTTVRVPVSTLGAQLDIPDLTLAQGDAGPTSAVLSGTVSLAGLVSSQVTVQVGLSTVDGNLVVTATDAALGAPGQSQTRLPDIVAPVLLGQLSRTIALDQLPFAVPATGVSVSGSDLVVTGQGTDVTVDTTAQR